MITAVENHQFKHQSAALSGESECEKFVSSANRGEGDIQIRHCDQAWHYYNRGVVCDENGHHSAAVEEGLLWVWMQTERGRCYRATLRAAGVMAAITELTSCTDSQISPILIMTTKDTPHV